MKLHTFIITSTVLGVVTLGSFHAMADKSVQQKDITHVGWSVDYQGCQYNSTRHTSTYTYSLTTQHHEAELSHWVLGIFENKIEVVSQSSKQQTSNLNYDPETGIHGFKWNQKQNSNSVQTYQISVTGECTESVTDYAVLGEGYFAIGSTMGPSIAPQDNRTNASNIAKKRLEEKHEATDITSIKTNAQPKFKAEFGYSAKTS